MNQLLFTLASVLILLEFIQMAGNGSLGLSAFLSTSKRNFVNNDNDSNVTVVIGNESCDLDTAVSSIVYAYFIFVEGNIVIDNNSSVIVLPVLNVDRNNYVVKTEVKYFLSSNKISENDIVFRDEIDLIKLHDEKRLKLVLVDHHVLQNEYAVLESSVVKILDHRPKDKKSNWSNNISRIELVGSCTTLVGDEILKKNENIFVNNSDIATLIYGTIILDTFCFSDTVKRYTDLDREVANKCRALGKIDIPEEELCDKLKKSKNDVSQLTPKQLLVKDMKLVRCIPLSTLTTSAEAFLTKPDAEEYVKSFCKEYNTPLFIMLGVTWDGDEQKRDLFIYCNVDYENDKIKDKGGSEEFAECIIRHFNDYTLLDLQFIRDVFSGYLFKQNNTTLTRKHILPIVENAYKDFTDEP